MLETLPMTSPNAKHAILLSEAHWKRCEKCNAAVPEFEFSESFEKEISGLLRTNPSWVMHRLQQEGCEMSIAKAWTLHHIPSSDYAHEPTPCPWCGRPLRTEKAKQCRHCGKDWH